MKTEGKRVSVTDATQSPLNPKRWCLELDCGHDIWVTSEKKPTRKTATCMDPSHEARP